MEPVERKCKIWQCNLSRQKTENSQERSNQDSLNCLSENQDLQIQHKKSSFFWKQKLLRYGTTTIVDKFQEQRILNRINCRHHQRRRKLFSYVLKDESSSWTLGSFSWFSKLCWAARRRAKNWRTKEEDPFFVIRLATTTTTVVLLCQNLDIANKETILQ